MIYMLGNYEIGFAKIGTTKNLAVRITGIQNACPFDLTLIAERDGGHKLEFAIHKACAKFHHAREWFVLSDDLVSLFHCVPEPAGRMRAQKIAREIPSTEGGEIIDLLGGISAVAKATGAKPSAVSNWRLAGRSIPWKHRPALARLAAERALTLPAGYWGQS